jgi:acetyl esterase/lipase
MLDDRTALRTQLDAINHFMWNDLSNRQAWIWYLGQPAGSSEVPPYTAAARRSDLSGLPPAWITTGDIELFYEEDCQYAARLEEAGVECSLYVTPKTPHCFDVVMPESLLARDMYRSAYQFLNDKLGLMYSDEIDHRKEAAN